MTDAERIALIEQFFAALEAEDQDTAVSFYADNVIVWHNADNREKDKAGSLAILKAVFGLLKSPRYEVLRREPINGGVLQTHILHATMPDGRSFAIHAAIVFECANGKITRLEEFVDAVTFNKQMEQARAAS
ncbi:MAG: nuclear transport factor 2 family protein [Alphaproteobacteria bacterium]